MSPHATDLAESVAGLTLRGGKRTRAFLCWLGHESVKGDKRNAINKVLMNAMMAVELFQSFALIHDDIIDGDALRRDGAAIHEKFKAESLPFNVKHAAHFGESMAILAGDLAIAWADELMEKVKSEKSKANSIYQRMKEEVILGQSLDVLSASGMPSADRTTINRYKTAWYSVVRPLQIGAAIAGAGQKTIDAFVPYGLAVGEGYQARDDFLDGGIHAQSWNDRSVQILQDATRAIDGLAIRQQTRTLFEDFSRFAINRET